MPKHLTAVTVLTLGTLTLTACGSSSSKSSAPVAPPSVTSSAAPTATVTPSSAPSSASTSAAPIAVTGTIDDAVYGNVIKVSSLVRNFPIPTKFSAIKGQKEIVLVKVALTAGSKYTGGIDTSAFRIMGADGSDLNTQTTIVDSEITTAGYTPISNGGLVSSGKSETGWVAFTVSPPDSTKLTLEYKRGAATIIGGGGSIPAKTFTVLLVK